jgi:hypothetical protein
MRSRLTSLFLLAPLAATGIALLDSAPVAAEDTGVCSLLTRTEAGELLGAEVVKTTTKTSKTNGAEECTYRTKKVQKEFKDRNLKISLELTVQPVTDEVRSELQNIPFDDGSRVQGLGDEAYVTKFDQCVDQVQERLGRRGESRAPTTRPAPSTDELIERAVGLEAFSFLG